MSRSTQLVSPAINWFFALAVGVSSMTACAETVEVEVRKMEFIPSELTINKGDTVRWVNRERRQYHSVWFEELGEEEPADYFWPEETFERQFNEAGSFPYRCGPHDGMSGVVIVK
jgi:plastocyanin